MVSPSGVHDEHHPRSNPRASLKPANVAQVGNHGLIAVGEDLAGAFKVAVAVEENAAVFYHASLLGTPNVIQLADVVIPEGARLP